MKKCLMILLALALAGCSNQENTQNKSASASSTSQTANACGPESDCQSTSYDPSFMKEISMDDAIDMMENGESGIIYFGFESCPWCKDALPVLHQAADETGAEIYYVKTRDENRNRLYTDEQKEVFTPYLQDYMSDNDEGVLTLFVPAVVRFENGTAISGHVGTLDDHDATERTMTDDENNQLLEIYRNILKQA